MTSLFGGGYKPPPPAPLPAPLPKPPTLASPDVQSAGNSAAAAYLAGGAGATDLTAGKTSKQYNALTVLGGAAPT